MIELILGTFAIVWILSFWHKTEWLREKLGIYYIEADGYVDRDDGGGLGGWVNCPMCCAFLAIIPVTTLWLWFPQGLTVLAGIGGTLLIVRLFESNILRPKTEWWR